MRGAARGLAAKAQEEAPFQGLNRQTERLDDESAGLPLADRKDRFREMKRPAAHGGNVGPDWK
jgi:hypothetical protein